MNKRQILILWIIAAVLVVALITVNSSRSDGYLAATERKRGETLLENFPASEVTQIQIHRGADRVTLNKADDQWTVAERDNYPANASTVYDLLRTIAEVKVTQGIEADASLAPRFGMDPDADDKSEQGTNLRLSSSEGPLAELTFGRNLESGSAGSPFAIGGSSTGRFVRVHSDESGIYVTSELFSTLTSDVTRWLDDSFLKIEKIQSVAVSKPGQENETAWKLTRTDESADFTLVGKKENENLDSSATNPLKNLFSYARFEDVIPKAEADSLWEKDKRQTAVIETL
ncbi:MAG: DUF4340 domain-containing protein, partial [Verrucomicrobiales bacterium]